MKEEEIERLLNRYYDGRTSEQEEEALHQALLDAGNELSPRLQAEKRLYLALHTGMTQSEVEARMPHGLEQRLGRLIDREAATADTGHRQRVSHRTWLRVSSIAASILLVTGIGLGITDMKRHTPTATWEDTYTDPYDADRALHDILSELSESWNDGLKQLADGQNGMEADRRHAPDKEIHP